MFKTKLDYSDIVLKQLSNKLDKIKQENVKLNLINPSSSKHQGELVIPFYKLISHFVYFIRQHSELNYLFNERLIFNESIKTNSEYCKVIHESIATLKGIAKKIQSRPDIKGFYLFNTACYPNPATIRPLVYSEEFLTALAQIKATNQLDLNKMESSIGGLISLINKYGMFANDILEYLEPTFESLNNCEASVKFLKDYLPEYHQIQSFVYVNLLYEVFNPLTFRSNDVVYDAVKNNILSGNFSVESHELVSDCENVYGHIEYQLLNKSTREFTILKFKNYVELYLYQQLDFNLHEEKLQIHFEQFLFLHDYYPIAQSKLGKGKLRTDIIAFNMNSAFLYEIKKMKLSKKVLVGGLIQANRYAESLAKLPGFSNNVYIIVFTENEVSAINNSISVNGNLFHFYFINISKTAPSHQKNILFVDCNELIRK